MLTGPARLRAAACMLGAAVLFKGVVWALVLPPLDGLDEAVHFSYAQLLATDGRLPSELARGGEGPDVLALRSATLVTRLNAVPFAAAFYAPRLAPGERGTDEASLSHIGPHPGRQSLAAEYGPVGYGLYALAIKLTIAGGVVAETFAARLVSAALGAAAAMVVVWAGLQAGLRWRSAFVAGVIVGFQPMWSQQTATVNADAPALLGATVVLALELAFIRSPTRRLGAGMVLVLALGLMAKPSLAFLIPTLAVLYLPVFQPRRPRAQRIGSAVLASAGAAAAVAPFAIWSAHWAGPVAESIRAGLVLNGAATAGIAHQGAYISVLRPAYLLFVHDSGWGDFGWLEVEFPAPVRLILLFVTVNAMLLGVTAMRRGTLRSRVTSAFLALVVVANVLFLGVVDSREWAIGGQTTLHGRYLLPALPAAVILAMKGLEHVGLGRRLAAVTVALAPAAIFLNLVGLNLLWARNLLN